MFLVEDKQHISPPLLVFTWQNPRRDGYMGDLIEGVTLDYDDAVHAWPEGTASPRTCVGRPLENPKHYKVFKYDTERRSAGYEFVPGSVGVFETWTDYLKLIHPELLPDDDWYGQLDRYDEASRNRRHRAPALPLPDGKNRDDVAAWVARRHFIADSSVQEVWYLPSQAPSQEIRLLELSDRLTVSEAKAEAVDFGLDVEGASFRLFVADISSEQLALIKQDSSHLPTGWSLDGSQRWKRGT